MSETPAVSDTNVESPDVCCGVKYPHWAGRSPLPAGCQLCPKSPTYWRNSDTSAGVVYPPRQPAEPAPTFHAA